MSKGTKGHGKSRGRKRIGASEVIIGEAGGSGSFVGVSSIKGLGRQVFGPITCLVREVKG